MKSFHFLPVILLGVLAGFLSSCEEEQKPAPPSFVPIHINCGGDRVRDGKTGVVWEADKDYTRKGKKYQFKNRPLTLGMKNAAPKDVYQTVRRQRVAYRLKNVPDGIYRLRLHFMDGEKHHHRSMNFWVNGRPVIQNLNVTESANQQFRALLHEVVVKVDGGHGMAIKGSRGRGDDIFLSAIEVLPAPAGAVPQELATAASKRPANLAAELQQFAGGAVRLVWTRTDEEDDYYQQQNTGVLWGIDSADGVGERIILQQQRSYAMPLLTPDGRKVVFTDQQMHKCYEIGFDGSGLRELVDGYASEVWKDPATGTTWLYVRTGWQDVNAPVVRHDLNDLSVKEVVWDKSASGIREASWFTVSGDGRLAVDGFPWPQCGVADLVEEDLHFLTKGCWPAVSPDRSSRLFVFTGKHTDIEMFDNPDARPRTVPLSTVPGWTGRKIYHPRWTNDARFITATAPQWMPQTELYLGKFNDGYTGIQHWFRVTYNESADYFGDAWFARAAEEQGAAQQAPAAGAAVMRRSSPPVQEAAGLVFVWENESARNAVMDANGKVKRVWNARYVGQTRPNRWYGADVQNGGVLPSEDAPAVIARAMKESRQFTMMMDVKAAPPADGNAAGQDEGVLAYAGDDQGNASFLIKQRSDQWIVAMQGADGKLVEAAAGKVAEDWSQLAVSFAEGRLKTYRDGVLHAEIAAAVDPATWRMESLMFGCDPAQQHGWRGSLENVKWYERALGDDSISKFHETANARRQSRSAVERIVVEAELVEVSDPADPVAIAPYTRSLGENLYQVKKVISGTLDSEEIVVLQWVILGGQIIEPVDHEVGKTYRLSLEKLEAHPELSGEHRSTDLMELEAKIFYDVES